MHMPVPDSPTRDETCLIFGQPLSDLERRVVHLGRADADRGDRGRSRWPRMRAFLAGLAGHNPAPPLAEERLETLRRFASATRRGDKAGANSIARELRVLGFSADALGTAAALARR
jgi:hypothetical protein